MSQANSRQYERDKRSTNPFKKPLQPHKDQGENQGLSGSEWGLPQIEWLGINREWDCDISQILGLDSEFQPDSQLQHSIVDALSMPWEAILKSNDLDQSSLYANLAHLARPVRPLQDYDKSSTIEGPSSQPASQDRDSITPFSSPRQRQEPSTPARRIRSSPPLMPASLTPRPKRQCQSPSHHHNPQLPFSSPLSSPPATIKPPSLNSPPQALKSTSASRPQPHDQDRLEVGEAVDDQDEGCRDDDAQRISGFKSESGLPQPPLRHDSEDALDEDAQGKGKSTSYSSLPSFSTTDRWSTRRSSKKPVDYIPEDHSSDFDPKLKSRSSSEDLDYQPSSPQAPLELPSSEAHNISKVQLKSEHKPEEDVKFTAKVFLIQLRNLIRNTCQDNRTDSGRQWDLYMVNGPGRNNKKCLIDTYMIVSNPDATLTVTAVDKGSKKPRDREVRLIVECKPALHNLTANRIFGQEVAEMLVEVLRLREYHRLDKYTVYLMSWHHLECYFSRMDVTEAYVAQLSDTSDLQLHEPPYVRQSRKLSFRDDSERVQIGEISARMVIEMLAMYKQPKKLGIIQHLTS